MSVGTTVELFLPFSGGHCQLPSLAQPRVAHSLDFPVICGGYDQWRSCVQLAGSEWVSLGSSLLYARYYHLSWRSASGLTLAGGLGSGALTTETLSSDGTSLETFSLRNSTVSACAISLPDSLLITGGFETLTSALLYDITGFLQDLPSLNTGRHDHGCSHYLDEEGSPV